MTVSDSIGVAASPKRGKRANRSLDIELIRKIAWRMQALAEGDLNERARRRAAELANNADVRVTPPRGQHVTTGGDAAVQADVVPDNRVPAPGGAIVRNYRGRRVRVVVLVDGFEYEGRRYKSLSAVFTGRTAARFHSGSPGPRDTPAPGQLHAVNSRGPARTGRDRRW